MSHLAPNLPHSPITRALPRLDFLIPKPEHGAQIVAKLRVYSPFQDTQKDFSSLKEDFMATYIPAFRAQMGDLGYFVSVVTLGEVARLIDFVEEVDEWTIETPPALKLQRRLNTERVERELVPYLLSGDDHFYSAITVEIRCAPSDDPGGVEPLAFSNAQAFPSRIWNANPRRHRNSLCSGWAASPQVNRTCYSTATPIGQRAHLAHHDSFPKCHSISNPFQ